ncbi:MAG: hypothetical protein GXO74_06240 [Calditrichaeota bacterium]|nr:hypothetical protein [Calditrichota bacterium]
MRILFAVFALFCQFSALLAQADFALFTRYDQLRVSPSRDSLAFRCVILDEAQPESPQLRVLLFTRKNDQPVCLNPQPERFVVSEDAKYLLFSAPTGLYLMTLNAIPRVGQVAFRQIGSQWEFEKFGFLLSGKRIFFKIKGGKNSDGSYYFRKPELAGPARPVFWLNLKKENKPHPGAAFQLPLFEIGKYSNISNGRQRSFFGFVRDSLSQFPGDYFLILKEKNSERILLSDCRPRLLAPNADSSQILVSVFHKNKNKNYLFERGTQKLILFSDKLIVSVSWLGRDKFIYLTESGLFLHSVSGGKTTRLSDWRFPNWYSIDLQIPKYKIEIKVDGKKFDEKAFFNALHKLGFSDKLISEQNQTKTIRNFHLGGFVSQSEALSAGEKLRHFGYNFHIERIHDIYNFFSNPGGEEQQPFDDGYAKIQYRKKQFRESRIIYVDRAGNFEILVPPMNSANSQ